MERSSEETIPFENSRERMADRPAPDDSDADVSSVALDDTAPEPGGGPAVDDV